jgi:hypothetical protein
VFQHAAYQAILYLRGLFGLLHRLPAANFNSFVLAQIATDGKQLWCNVGSTAGQLG